MAEDEELTGHEVTPWTAGQLRKALEGVPDDLPVEVITADSEEQVITSAGPWAHACGSTDEVHARLASGELQPGHFEIGCEFPSAEYYRRQSDA